MCKTRQLSCRDEEKRSVNGKHVTMKPLIEAQLQNKQYQRKRKNSQPPFDAVMDEELGPW